jgi:hypothetical protein
VVIILLILRNNFIKNEYIDVYLQSLVEELEELWKGVKAYNVTRPKCSFESMLRVICMWSLHDYIAYGLFVDYQTKGYFACLLCGPKVDTKHSSHLKKNVYLGH